MPVLAALFSKHKDTLLYGLCLALLTFLLKWLELRLLIIHHALEVYIGLVAIAFTALGIWLALKLAKPRIETVVIEREVRVPGESTFALNEAELTRLGLSGRELEVLQLMAQGLSNQEIAERLFLSLNTVKTHCARLFEKLEVKRRTQAVDMGKRLGLIP